MLEKLYYKSLKTFGGMFECYNYDYKELLMELISENNEPDTS